MDWNDLTEEQKTRFMHLQNDQIFSYDEIECPYCKTRADIESEDLPYDDGSEADYDCDNCGKNFTVTTSVSYSFSTMIPDEEVYKMIKDEADNE